MGTWGSGAFDNDAALDFLDSLGSATEPPAQSIADTLHAVTQAPSGEYIDVDAGSMAWAAAELLALASSPGDTHARRADVRKIAASLTPTRAARSLALEALTRIADRTTSELAALWHEGDEGTGFDATLAQLRERLEAADHS